MPISPPTIDELVAIVKRSQLPTVIVEGKDDIVIYRWMESVLKDTNVDFLPCHCRSTVLALFDRRAEFPDKRVVFVADQDMWVFDGTPTQYGDVLFTSGYSVENDVLASRAVDRLFDGGEKAAFHRALTALEEWFAFEAAEYLAGRSFTVDVSLKQIVDPASGEMATTHLSSRGFKPVTGSIREKIAANPMLMVRGKNVLDAYVQVLNADRRPARYPRMVILEMSVKYAEPHPHCDRLVQDIRRRLGRP